MRIKHAARAARRHQGVAFIRDGAHGQALHALAGQERAAEGHVTLVRDHGTLAREHFFIAEFDLKHLFIDLLIDRHRGSSLT
ncbi:hypothetical protein D3C72_2117740 [compost metagenome]